MAHRHLVRPASAADLVTPPAFAGHSRDFRRWAGVDHSTPAVHTGFGLNDLQPGGSIDWHVHSFEQSVSVLDGVLTGDTSEGSFRLQRGDYGVVPVGQPHAFRNLGDAVARWNDMLAPQPQPDFDGDTFFVENRTPGAPVPIDVRDPRTRAFGHVSPEQMDPTLQTQDRLAVSASMRSALLVYSGITVKMMVDTDLGAQLMTMFMVQYEPDGFAGVHDHPLEETYDILEGEVDAVLDGIPYRLRPGDLAFAGLGSTHAFSNPTDQPVRWLETQSPQPTARHAYRFSRDWGFLQERLRSRAAGRRESGTHTF